ncbi:MAG: ROK family protein [Candidatus Nanopelagicales bacterium]
MTTTLCIDIGGSGLKAALCSDDGTMISERVKIKTPYPCPPSRLVESLLKLVTPLGDYDRVSVGFPGLVRNGVVGNIPSLSRSAYDGVTDPALVAAWHGYDLQRALQQVFPKPLRLANDADVQGAAVVEGRGFEFVMTLGTGIGTAVFQDGVLLPHLELSHALFRTDTDFDAAIGNVARKAIGNERWMGRVIRAIDLFDQILFFDHCYIGGGNAVRLAGLELPPRCHIVSNTAGLLGGVRLWDHTV